MRGDARAYRVAVVADSLLGGLVDVLEDERWGVMQLPPAGLDAATASAWLEHVAEHVVEFRRNDYDVVLLLDDGSAAEELDTALAELGVDRLPRLEGAAGERRVREFLRRSVTRAPHPG